MSLSACLFVDLRVSFLPTHEFISDGNFESMFPHPTSFAVRCTRTKSTSDVHRFLDLLIFDFLLRVANNRNSIQHVLKIDRVGLRAMELIRDRLHSLHQDLSK